MFRKEKTVPNMSFASSSALSAGRDRATVPLIVASEAGRDDFPEGGAAGSQLRL